MQLKRNLSTCTKWMSKLNLFILQFHFYFNMRKKLWTHISFSSTCFCFYRRYPNRDNKIFPYHLIASNSNFMADSQYLGTIPTWRNLNERHHYLISSKFVICQTGANCFPFQSLNMPPFYIRLKCLKPNLLQFNIKFS